MGVGRNAEAVKLLQELQQSPEKTDAREARLRIASIEYGAGRKAEAHRIVDELIAERPRYAEARTAKARMLLSDGAPASEAVAQAREAVKADPNLPAAHYTLGLAAFADRNLDEAAKAFEEAVKLSPQAAAARMQLARVKLAQRRRGRRGLDRRAGGQRAPGRRRCGGAARPDACAPAAIRTARRRTVRRALPRAGATRRRCTRSWDGSSCSAGRPRPPGRRSTRRFARCPDRPTRGRASLPHSSPTQGRRGAEADRGMGSRRPRGSPRAAAAGGRRDSPLETWPAAEQTLKR